MKSACASIMSRVRAADVGDGEEEEQQIDVWIRVRSCSQILRSRKTAFDGTDVHRQTDHWT